MPPLGRPAQLISITRGCAHDTLYLVLACPASWQPGGALTLHVHTHVALFMAPTDLQCSYSSHMLLTLQQELKDCKSLECMSHQL
jgi:hypothetical protein